jgi:hypothetical protein
MTLSSFRQFKFFSVLILAIFMGKYSFAQDARDTLIGDGDNYLEMRGKVFKSEGQQRDDDKVGLDSADVRVTNEAGKEVLFGLTDSKGRLAFRLPLGRKFTLHITKKGFVNKMILVDTHVAIEDRKDFTFTFDIDIFEKVDGLDVSVLNQPVAKVSFRALDKTFTYDAAYTNKVNSGLQKMYREYYNLKKKENAVNASDSISSKPTSVKAEGIKKSVPYGRNTKPH